MKRGGQIRDWTLAVNRPKLNSNAVPRLFYILCTPTHTQLPLVGYHPPFAFAGVATESPLQFYPPAFFRAANGFRFHGTIANQHQRYLSPQSCHLPPECALLARATICNLPIYCLQSDDRSSHHPSVYAT
jgi:hypothetical protein